MANLFYRNTNAKISFEILDTSNNFVGLSATSTVYYYILSPDNFIYSNDSNVGIYTYANGTGVLISNPILEEKPGVYYVNYVLSKIGDYKYKFQISDSVNSVNLSIAGSIKVVTDGIF